MRTYVKDLENLVRLFAILNNNTVKMMVCSNDGVPSIYVSMRNADDDYYLGRIYGVDVYVVRKLITPLNAVCSEPFTDNINNVLSKLNQ